MEMGALRVSDANLVVYLHPSQSNNVNRAVLRELSTLLFKYNENLDGVVLAYAVRSLNNAARILDGVQPYLGMRLNAKLLMFSPKPGMLLEGKVVKLSHESIHVVVLGFLSAIITSEDIRNEFKFKSKHGEVLFVSRSHKHHVIKVGAMIRFLVKRFDEEVLHMTGSLIPDHTGSFSWLEKNSEDHTHESGSKKRTETEGTIGREGSSLSNPHKDKKSKKQRIEDH